MGGNWTFECRIDYLLPNIEDGEEKEAGALKTKKMCVLFVIITRRRRRKSCQKKSDEGFIIYVDIITRQSID